MQKELQRDIHYNIADVPIRNDMTIYVIIFKSISIELHAANIYYGYGYTNISCVLYRRTLLCCVLQKTHVAVHFETHID